MNIEKIDNLDAAIVKSKLLVADPYMNESQFKRAVVLLCEHNNETGTLGFILNKNLNIDEYSTKKNFKNHKNNFNNEITRNLGLSSGKIKVYLKFNVNSIGEISKIKPS